MAPPAVGDLLLAGDGTPTWGYAAHALEPGCWVVFLSAARTDGDWIDADTGTTTVLPAVDVHLRIPKAAIFASPVGADGELLGRALCLDSAGRVVSAH